jgi:hypothetical protein
MENDTDKTIRILIDKKIYLIVLGGYIFRITL